MDLSRTRFKICARNAKTFPEGEHRAVSFPAEDIDPVGKERKMPPLHNQGPTVLRPNADLGLGGRGCWSGYGRNRGRRCAHRLNGRKGRFERVKKSPSGSDNQKNESAQDIIAKHTDAHRYFYFIISK